ncbi:MAG TPA: RecX family transcriptional regulator [Patescibacteria group bacterium]|nr:RecX family transcriptional regulator [Patescibacteria group bacterium]
MKITAIKQQVKRHDRYSIFVDGAYTCSISESGLIESHLASGQELDEIQFADLKRMAGADKAYGNALRYVAMRPRSEWELRDYFRRKQIDEGIASPIIERLRNVDLLNDLAFAKSWVESRRLLKSISKRRLILELQQKRVPEDIIHKVLEMDTSDDRAQLQVLIEKKRNRYPDDQKLMQYLARQGFGYDEIKTALRAVEED